MSGYSSVVGKESKAMAGCCVAISPCALPGHRVSRFELAACPWAAPALDPSAIQGNMCSGFLNPRAGGVALNFLHCSCLIYPTEGDHI